MMKPKVALVKCGFLPPGSENKRGRLSAAAIEKLNELASEGQQIEGYTVTETKNSTPAKPERVVTREKAVNPASQVVEPFYRYGEHGVTTHEAVTADGRVYDLKQACKCGYSLSGHTCESPAIQTEKMLGHERVTIRLKRNA